MKRAIKDIFALYNEYVQQEGHENVAIVFGSNLSIKKDGTNVMGAGLAKQLKNAYPGIEKAHGDALKEFKGVQNIDFYYEGSEDPIVVAFPVKEHWSEKAKLSLIEKSCHELKEIACENKKMTFLWAFPGIGNGKLDPKDVIKIIKKVEMPDNCVLVSKERGENNMPKGFITVIGSRNITEKEKERLYKLAKVYHDRGYTLRSGGAHGADSIVNEFQNVEIIIPWNGFNGLRHDGRRIFELSQLKDNARAKELVIKIHPAPKKLTEGAMKLHMRNIYQITGVHGVHKRNLSKGVLYVADEHNGRVKGGTATAVHLAKKMKIKTHNIR